MPPFQPIAACVPPPPLSVLLQGQGVPHILPSTLRTYVPLISPLLLRQGIPVCNTSDEPDPLPQISAYFIQ